MKIIIDTHDSEEAIVEVLTAYLAGNSWDYRVNNAEDKPEALHPDPNMENDCQHNFVNGICQKCSWLQI